MECQLRVIMEQSELPGSHYLSFIAMLQQYGRHEVFARLPAEFHDATRGYVEQLSGFLPHIVEPLRTHRLAQATMFVVHYAADRERARANNRNVLPFAVAVAELLDGIVGFLTAPVSAAALDALDGYQVTGSS